MTETTAQLGFGNPLLPEAGRRLLITAVVLEGRNTDLPRHRTELNLSPQDSFKKKTHSVLAISIADARVYG